jgi:hypothetical protein
MGLVFKSGELRMIYTRDSQNGVPFFLQVKGGFPCTRNHVSQTTLQKTQDRIRNKTSSQGIWNGMAPSFGLIFRSKRNQTIKVSYSHLHHCCVLCKGLLEGTGENGKNCKWFKMDRPIADTR